MILIPVRPATPRSRDGSTMTCWPVPEARRRPGPLLLVHQLEKRRTQKDPVRGRGRDWAIDAEDRNLVSLARSGVLELDAVGEVEASDDWPARITRPARQLAVDPDLTVV